MKYFQKIRSYIFSGFLFSVLFITPGKKETQNESVTGETVSGQKKVSQYISPTPNSSTAALYIWGYLWSDSQGGNKTNWSYRHKVGVGQTVSISPCVARFKQAALLMNATVTNERRTGNGTKASPYIDHISVVFPNALNIVLLEMPAVVANTTIERTAGFLAAVIEGEGNNKGLIIDDFYQAHHEVIKKLLDRMGVKHFTTNDGLPDPPSENKKFKRTGLIDQAGIDEVSRWPFVDHSRVPKRFENWQEK